MQTQLKPNTTATTKRDKESGARRVHLEIRAAAGARAAANELQAAGVHVHCPWLTQARPQATRCDNGELSPCPMLADTSFYVHLAELISWTIPLQDHQPHTRSAYSAALAPRPSLPRATTTSRTTSTSVVSATLHLVHHTDRPSTWASSSTPSPG